jgi:hypothetical protein
LKHEGQVCGDGTTDQIGNFHWGDRTREIVMFHGTYDRAARADRYREVAVEYTRLSEATSDQFLRSYYIRIAEDYQDQSQRELLALEREQITALATGADMPSPTPQPNHPN